MLSLKVYRTREVEEKGNLVLNLGHIPEQVDEDLAKICLQIGGDVC